MQGCVIRTNQKGDALQRRLLVQIVSFKNQAVRRRRATRPIAPRLSITNADGSGTAVMLMELELPLPVEPQVTPSSLEVMALAFVQPLAFRVVGAAVGLAGLQVTVPAPPVF